MGFPRSDHGQIQQPIGDTSTPWCPSKQALGRPSLTAKQFIPPGKKVSGQSTSQEGRSGATTSSSSCHCAMVKSYLFVKPRPYPYVSNCCSLLILSGVPGNSSIPRLSAKYAPIPPTSYGIRPRRRRSSPLPTVTLILCSAATPQRRAAQAMHTPPPTSPSWCGISRRRRSCRRGRSRTTIRS